MNNLHYFLKELNLLRQKYIITENSREKFNIFTTLLDPYNTERELHSRFISSILDPNGSHKMGDLPLRLFLEELGSHFQISKHTIVSPNNESWTEHSKIDILIIDRYSKNAIIIENKINAADSNHKDRGQLEGYYQQIISEGIPCGDIEVFYLTIDRHEPSQDSVNTNGNTPELANKVRCIDYATEIYSWLQKLAQQAYKHPYLRESINQYLNLIKDMTGNSEIEERLELMALVGKNEDNLESARLLINNFDHICWHSIDCFNRELQESLANKNIRIIEAPESDIITNLVHGGPQKRKVDFYYTLEGKNGLVWTLQADYDDTKGFYIGLNKESNKKLDKKSKETIKQFAKEKQLDSNQYWYFWKYLSENYNLSILYFWDFKYPNTGTFDIISQAKRKLIIEGYTKAIIKELSLDLSLF